MSISINSVEPPRTSQVDFYSSLNEHYCNVDLNDEPLEDVQTGLLCELGISQRESEHIQRLIAAGMTVARINLCDLPPEVCGTIIQNLRKAVYNYSSDLNYIYPLAVIADVKGHEIITGIPEAGTRATLEIVESENVRLTNDETYIMKCSAEIVYIDIMSFRGLKPDDLIYIYCVTPGEVELKIKRVDITGVDCVANNTGKIGSKMGVRIPRLSIGQSCNNKDAGDAGDNDCFQPSALDFERIEEQIQWAINCDIDAVLVPCTQTVNDVMIVKNLLDKAKQMLVIASIDTCLGIENIDSILEIADGIYFDRNMLCKDLQIEKICVAQKILVAKCNDVGKPCICKAYINELIPTLCISDVVNLATDGVDVLAIERLDADPRSVLMDSSLRHIEHCLVATAIICRHTERFIWHPKILGYQEIMEDSKDNPTLSISFNAVELAMRSKAIVIICLTKSGRTARTLSYLKPTCPIVAVTRACHVARQLRFWKSVRAVHYLDETSGNWESQMETRIYVAIAYCKTKRIMRDGDPYVVVMGSRRGVGFCDVVKLEFMPYT